MKNYQTESMVRVENNIVKSDFGPVADESVNLESLKAHIRKYPERWNTAFAFLASVDPDTLPLGRVDLSEEVYYSVSEYLTRNMEDSKYESHEKYIDFQYVISGEEYIYLTSPGPALETVSPYDESKDITFFRYEGGKQLLATPERYFLFFPEDVHKPCVRVKGNDLIKKLVIKIRYN